MNQQFSATTFCIEGPLAVGKSTTAAALAAIHGAFVVPEMNRLFRPTEENPDARNRRSFGAFVAEQEPNWYLNRQVERWAMAEYAKRQGSLVILDRDPFQPLWHRWAFGYEGEGQTADELRAFYRPLLTSGALRFPDGYILLAASSQALRHRKENDASRDRRGFEKQVRFFAPQKRYFQAFSALVPDRVLIINTRTITENVSKIENVLPAFAGVRTAAKDETALFDALTDWLAIHDPHGAEDPST